MPRRTVSPLFVTVALVAASAALAASAEQPVNVNEASEGELMTLPGVTRAVAKRIVEHRPYRTIEQVIVEADLPLETVRVARTRLALFTTHAPPPRGDGSAPADPGPRAMDPALLLIDVNAAPEDVLVTSLGLERAAARRVVAARPFTSTSQFFALAGLPAEKAKGIAFRVLLAPPPGPAPPSRETRIADPVAPIRSTPVPSRVPLAERLDVNTATPEEVSLRCTVDPMTARRIIASRPYASIADLARKMHLTPGERERLAGCLRVRDATPPTQ